MHPFDRPNEPNVFGVLDRLHRADGHSVEQNIEDMQLHQKPLELVILKLKVKIELDAVDEDRQTFFARGALHASVARSHNAEFGRVGHEAGRQDWLHVTVYTLQILA